LEGREALKPGIWYAAVKRMILFVLPSSAVVGRFASEKKGEAWREAAQAERQKNMLQYQVLNIMMFRNVNNWYHHQQCHQVQKRRFERTLTETKE
jgi:hypothetical protein